MWIAFRESSHGVMPYIVVISVLPQERVLNAFYPRRVTKAVSRRIRKRPCCQESAGCSKELLKIREIQEPRKSTSVAYFFDNVYNRNVRDVDKYLHVTVSINTYTVFVVTKYMPGSVMTMYAFDLYIQMYNIWRSALINTMYKVYANLANCDWGFCSMHLIHAIGTLINVICTAHH